MSITLIIGIAIAVGMFYLAILRQFDIYEKEPYAIMLATFLIGGISSIIVSTLFYLFVDVEHTFFQAFYKVGMIEEVAKLSGFFLTYRIIRKHFDEMVDGILYISCIALGFAVIENIIYAMNAQNPLYILTIRAVTSTIGHMVFSSTMGVALFIHLKVNDNKFGILISILIAAFGHGFYDGVLFEPQLSWSFWIVYSLLVIGVLWLLKLTLSFSKFRKSFNYQLYIPTSKIATHTCSNCGTTTTGKVLMFWKIETHPCKKCGYLLFNYKQWKRVHQYYLPLRNWKKVIRYYRNNPNRPVRFGKHSEHMVDLNPFVVSCNVTTLNNWLLTENNKDKNKALHFPILGKIMREIGLKYFK